MKITALKAQIKNPERVSVFVDGTYSFSLSLNEVLELKLKKDLQITDADITQFKKLSNDGKVRMRTAEWLLNRPHSTRELADYLYGKKVDADLKDKLVTDFTLKGFVSDERYAAWASERMIRKNKSTTAIKNELRNKGIATEIIAAIVSEKAGDDSDALNQLVLKMSSRSRYKDQKKLIAYLLSKGFTYAKIKQALRLVEPEQEP